MARIEDFWFYRTSRRTLFKAAAGMLGLAITGSSVQCGPAQAPISPKAIDFGEKPPQPPILKIKDAERKYGDKQLTDLETEFLREYVANLCDLYRDIFDSRFPKDEWLSLIQFFNKENEFKEKIEKERGQKGKLYPIEFSKPFFPRPSLYVFLGHSDFSSPRAIFSDRRRVNNSLVALRSELFSRFLLIETQERPLDPKFKAFLVENFPPEQQETLESFDRTKGFQIINPERTTLTTIDWGIRQHLLGYATRRVGLDHSMLFYPNEQQLVNVLSDLLLASGLHYEKLKELYFSSNLQEFANFIGNAQARIGKIPTENLSEDVFIRDGVRIFITLDGWASDGFPNPRKGPQPILPGEPPGKNTVKDVSFRQEVIV